MLQDLDTTIQKLEQRIREQGNRAEYVPRFSNIIKNYASEIARDLKDDNWYSKVSGGLSAGHLLCLMGETEKALNFFENSLIIHEENMNEYSSSISSILQSIIDTLQEFDPDKVEDYKSRLEKARKDEKPNLRREIIHIEADLECTTGDLNSTYAQEKANQARLFEKLGEYNEAISYFQKSNEFDKGFRYEYYIKNMLSIVDCYLKLGDKPQALGNFMELLNTLVPEDFQLGESLPSEFLDNFKKLYPYFERVGVDKDKTIKYTQARFEKLSHLDKEIIDRELRQLADTLIFDYIEQEKYAEALDVIDKAKELGKNLEYPPHFSAINQAEYLIRAEKKETAREILEQENPHDMMTSHWDKPLDIANLYLQIEDIDKALDLMDEHCKRKKGGLISGSYSDILDIRRQQIRIFKALIGEDYAERIRKDNQQFKLNGSLKALPSETDV